MPGILKAAVPIGEELAHSIGIFLMRIARGDPGLFQHAEPEVFQVGRSIDRVNDRLHHVAGEIHRARRRVLHRIERRLAGGIGEVIAPIGAGGKLAAVADQWGFIRLVELVAACRERLRRIKGRFVDRLIWLRRIERRFRRNKIVEHSSARCSTLPRWNQVVEHSVSHVWHPGGRYIRGTFRLRGANDRPD